MTIRKRISLSERDTQKALDLLDNPRGPNSRMVAALKTMPDDSDQQKESERLYVFKQLLKSRDDIEHGRLHTAEEVKAHTDKTIERLRAKYGE